MNLSVLNVALFGVGALLITAAIRNLSPRQIVANSTGAVAADRKQTPPANAQTGWTVTTGTAPSAGVGVIVTAP